MPVRRIWLMNTLVATGLALSGPSIAAGGGGGGGGRSVYNRAGDGDGTASNGPRKGPPPTCPAGSVAVVKSGTCLKLHADRLPGDVLYAQGPALTLAAHYRPAHRDME